MDSFFLSSSILHVVKEPMKLINNLDNIIQPYKNAVLTIGNFDGVHIGHQTLFEMVKQRAAAIDGTSIAMTFEPHPSRVLTKNGHPPLLTLYEQKIELISALDLDVVIAVPFTKHFASISAQGFIEDILVKRIGMKAIVIGEDYTFGKNREGNLVFLKACSKLLGFDVIVGDWIPMSDSRGGRISSTKVREQILAGKVTQAQASLGRHYQIRGTVETGRNRGGKLLGFPTANVRLTDELCPKSGVYAVTVQYMEELYTGVANIGYSPTFEDQIFTVEVHILDFDKDIYGESIRVNFIQRIRDEVKFDGVDQLISQIESDIETAKAVISR